MQELDKFALAIYRSASFDYLQTGTSPFVDTALAIGPSYSLLPDEQNLPHCKEVTSSVTDERALSTFFLLKQ